jgi:hypothetical protein
MSFNEISKNINKIKTFEKEKVKYSEFGTPFSLRQDMINKIPNYFWKNPNHKILEPCCGKGGFLIDIIKKLMENLNIPIYYRYKHIVENMLFFGDINKRNVNICRKLLGNYELNYFIGDTLTKDFSGFSLVIGNPPYSSYGKIETGNTIYQKFIKKALEDWLKPKGYLLFVTPPAWRKPVSIHSKNINMFNLMAKQNWIKYLEIHSAKDGKKIFDATTKYDWYLIQKTKPKKTIVKDLLGEICEINLKNWPWLPNFDFKLIKKLLAKKGEKTIEVISNGNYDSEKKHMSKRKTKKYKYSCVHLTPQKGIVYFYSSIKLDKFKPKVIFGDTGLSKAFVNKKGKYCLTEHAIGIVDKEKKLERILDALKSEQMKNIFKACLWSNFQIDWRMFRDFKKNFYKLI